MRCKTIRAIDGVMSRVFDKDQRLGKRFADWCWDVVDRECMLWMPRLHKRLEGRSKANPVYERKDQRTIKLEYLGLNGLLSYPTSSEFICYEEFTPPPPPRLTNTFPEGIPLKGVNEKYLFSRIAEVDGNIDELGGTIDDSVVGLPDVGIPLQNDEECRSSEDGNNGEIMLRVEEENPKSKDGVVSSEQNGKQSEDPFNIYSLLNKDKMKNNKEASTKESLEYPPGFTPRENDVENVEMDNQKDNCDGEFGNVNNISDEVNFSSGFNTYKKAGGESMDSDHCRESEGSRKGGSILMLMDELVKVGQTMGYNMDGCMKNIEEIIESQGVDGVNFLTLQETKMESIDLFEIKRCWGNFAFDYVHSASVGKSGGILCVWDPNAFKKLNSTASDYFVMIQGNWVSNGKLLLIISVYAPQELSEKKSLWDYLCHVIDNWKGSVIIMGDFNEVRNKNERFGTIFNVHGANAFNSFISMANLEEVPLGGCSFTWCHRSASKMSKLDRFLMSESLLSECPNLSAITLDRFLSDHRPILLRESTHDYGPIPFRFFHYWLEMEGFENFVNEVWREAPVDNSNAMINMMNKLKYLKKKIRVWNGMRQSPKTRKHVLKQELADLEMIIDKGDASSDTLHKRAEVVKSIQEVDKLCAMEASQKAKIKWAIEGDENSKYYHGILNKKRNQLSIRGVLVEGDWVENPNMVKNEFLNHFKNRFDRPKSVRPMLNMEFPHHLNSMQQLDLEAEVSNEEIKKAVWDCGVDKSPGPDGFTFGFYKRFWSLIEKDVLAAVKYFFHYSRIPKGCNSSFIALIPKTPEAKMVKDFRPISLIGSLYKIIAKILANRLVVVLGDIVNEVQSAFVADRQILDGPFILNEVLQWCKLKKKHSFILKIDFEKAYDSVRWDYLDDVLRKFGFGEKWCGWIQECLRSSWGSVLVNGSPTEEFQFFKGLKQGDPLSPFIFILVMESLHISFKRVVDAGMFNGIVLNSVMHLSHMFYADDAVFMGQWSTKNIDTIIYVLKCFHRASGLSINLSKSKLLGVVVSEDRVVQAANRIGCGVLKAPFAYLGSKVGGNMSRIKSWDEIVDKMVDRLSKWKMKTLSIGGRLTLLKAVLGSMPIYHMSIFKVPMKVLQRMESIRSRFFSGVDLNSKKSIWVKWSKVLCSKEKGGLGVSSLYALNRALMCKWVWRFTTQKNLLWTRVIKAIHGEDGKNRVIKAIHGEDGKNGSGFKVGYKSIWRSILQEVETLKIKGIHLNNFMQKKLGNGADTYFWEDLWHGDMVLKQRYPRLYALEVKKTVDVASKLSQENLTWSFRRAPRSGVEQDQLTDLTTYVEGVVLGVTPDRWYWTLDGSGEFSVASARKVIDDNRFPEVSTQTRWIKAVPIKVNIHAWKVRMDCLPTRLNISRRGIDIPSILCPVCGSVTESSSHLFFDCLVANDNFRKICRWWEVDFIEVHTFDEWVSWIVNLRIPIKHKRLLEGWFEFCWVPVLMADVSVVNVGGNYSGYRASTLGDVDKFRRAKHVWDELKETYDKVDGSVFLFNLHHKINSLRQNGISIADYYHKLNALWKQFDALVQLPSSELCVSLMSVHKVAKDSGLIIAFNEDKCFVLPQDLKEMKVLGTGSQIDGLYYFNDNMQDQWTFSLKRKHKSSVLAELVHLDLWGPYKVTSKEGYRFFLTVVDDYTSLYTDGLIFKAFRSEYTGSEFVNQRFTKFCVDNGIIHQTTCAYTPQQNVITVMPSSVRVLNLHDKFGSRAEKCVLVGYASFKKGYKLYSLEREQFIFSRDVRFFEKVFPFKIRQPQNTNLTSQGLDHVNFFNEVVYENPDTSNDDNNNNTKGQSDGSNSPNTSSPTFDQNVNDVGHSQGSNGSASEDEMVATFDPTSTNSEDDIVATSEPISDHVPTTSTPHVRRSERTSVFPRRYNDFVVESKAPRQWNAKLTQTLIEHGFIQSKSDYSLFTKTDHNSFIALLVYVDDIIITGNDVGKIEKFKAYLNTKFKIKDLGKLKYFLGIEVIDTDKGLCLSQRKYCLDLLSDFGLLACKPSATPLEQNLVVSNEPTSTDPVIDNVTEYQKLIEIVYGILKFLKDLNTGNS
ncbi:RNA-directed DNA polymerase, eukaryota [Tanacetum coccineum]